MEFGLVPVRAAEGAILAHSLQAGSLRLRKGRVLAADDLRALQAAGVPDVVVARLGLEDVGEDAAALAVASGLVPEPGAAGLRLTDAARGRVNLYATAPGVLEVDPVAIHALNRVDPMITLAVLPPFSRVAERMLVGTVKVIAYGVSRRSVEMAAQAGTGALRLHRPVLATATLIETEVRVPEGVAPASGTAAGAEHDGSAATGGKGASKGEEAIRKRLEALGMQLEETVRVPHREPELAAAIAEARGDVVLILTGSATSDPRDVGPEAVRRAGGRVDRFGMPVDPGNLLFVGAIGPRPVIGLPGCARSPALNGADWVLERIACGLPVGDSEIAAMGVGGLLKESPARPSPREGRR